MVSNCVNRSGMSLIVILTLWRIRLFRSERKWDECFRRGWARGIVWVVLQFRLPLVDC